MRIQVNLSDSMVERLDVLCDELGVSRSSFCSSAILWQLFDYEHKLKVKTEEEEAE